MALKNNFVCPTALNSSEVVAIFNAYFCSNDKAAIHHHRRRTDLIQQESESQIEYIKAGKPRSVLMVRFDLQQIGILRAENII